MSIHRVRKIERETARHAYERNVKTAREYLLLIAKQLVSIDDPHWGHVGDMAEVVKNLREAGHYAGVPELKQE